MGNDSSVYKFSQENPFNKSFNATSDYNKYCIHYYNNLLAPHLHSMNIDKEYVPRISTGQTLI